MPRLVFAPHSDYQAIYETLGPAALVDAVASFNAVVKVADGSGIQVDDSRQETAAKMRAELKLDFSPR